MWMEHTYMHMVTFLWIVVFVEAWVAQSVFLPVWFLDQNKDWQYSNRSNQPPLVVYILLLLSPSVQRGEKSVSVCF